MAMAAPERGPNHQIVARDNSLSESFSSIFWYFVLWIKVLTCPGRWAATPCSHDLDWEQVVWSSTTSLTAESGTAGLRVSVGNRISRLIFIFDLDLNTNIILNGKYYLHTATLTHVQILGSYELGENWKIWRREGKTFLKMVNIFKSSFGEGKY